MDLFFFTVQWSALAAVLLPWTTVRGVGPDVCATDPFSGFDEDLFETHTFEAEEGILLVPRKLIGTVTLSANDSGRYSFDEPFFSKPYNVKSKPRPAHFEVVFLNVSSAYNLSTSIPKQDYVATTPSRTSKTPNLFAALYDRPATGSPNNVSLNFEETSTAWSTVSLSSTNSTSFSTVNMTSTVVSPTAATDVVDGSCVVAKIYQIYDLDREESDTHYLTINNVDEDPLWGYPIVVIIKVTDINDNSPIFVKDSLESRIFPNTSPGTIVAEVKAIDDDIGINADLRYSLPFHTVKKGDQPASPDLPTVIIHEKLGIVALASPIADLVPPTKITFSVVVKDKGDSYVSNRATASVTISVINGSWIPELPSGRSITISAGAIVGIVLGSVLLGVVATVGVVFWKRRIRRQHNGQLELMLDDENLISA